ncbi:pentapeptide repeat-containing protein [Undibacterium sp. TS12]|uniref:pentapeptide repeat-containing protein n=1 Tax=Undibacterium sp. TS12 TaxID=2908202 RepID=UPI001F4CDF9A|nr:pentapeptide repeat-containing protein [Undibacterium sp. TS12]MCH8622250.1 pentapeptide repeat-containing protein [Undibacterium sp. TS12]
MEENKTLLGRNFNREDLSRSNFNEVMLAACDFSNVDFQGSRFDTVSFRHARMQNLDVEGMTIDGILVSELLRVYKEHKK